MRTPTRFKKHPLNIAIRAACYSMLGALPLAQATTGGVVVGGSGTINQSGTNTTINQATQNLAINWQTFNVAADERVQFIQPNVTSVALNRVIGNNGSSIKETKVTDIFNSLRVRSSQMSTGEKQSVGDGQCVAFVRAASGAPHTSVWKQGKLVKTVSTIFPGTAIATFDQNGKYGSRKDGTSHAAVFIRKSAIRNCGPRSMDHKRESAARA